MLGPAIQHFDGATGEPLGLEPVPLRCWHCGAPITQDAIDCLVCGVDLGTRTRASIAYDVAPRTGGVRLAETSAAAPPAPDPSRATGAADRPPVGGPARNAPPVPEIPSGPWALSPIVSDGGATTTQAGRTTYVPRARPPRSGGFIARHWRGEYALAFSVWVNFAGVNALINGTILLLIAPATDRLDSALTLFVLSVLFWGLRVVLVAWQLVGIWRSAGNSIARRKAAHRTYVWAVVARVWVVLAIAGVIRLAVASAAPELARLYEVGVLGDPDTPAFTVEAIPDGTAIVISGGIRFGIASATARVLDANPNVRRVYLTSPGGWMGPGELLYDLIRRRGLSTYAIIGCESACTVAFAGGRERAMGSLSTLGFHAPDYAGESRLARDSYRAYREAGFRPSFIARIATVPFDDMWYPTPAELLAAGVLTRQRDPTPRPADLPVATYLRVVADTLGTVIPIETAAAGVWMVAVEAEGDRLIVGIGIDRNAPPAGLAIETTQPADLCGNAIVEMAAGGTTVFAWRYLDGAPIRTVEVTPADCPYPPLAR